MLRKRTALIIGVIGITAGVLILAPATSAFAQSYNQWCIATHGCLNNWSDGPYVKNYNPNFIQNAIDLVQDTSRCNGGWTSTNCPIQGIPSGLQIVEIKNEDPNSFWWGYCFGDFNGSPTDAKVGDNVTCDNGGANGGYGIIYIYTPGYYFGCPGQSVFVNARWSGSWNSAVGLGWRTGSVGNQVYQNTNPLCGTFQQFTP